MLNETLSLKDFEVEDPSKKDAVVKVLTEEKRRLEKMNEELQSKLIDTKKKMTDDKNKALDKEKRRNKHQIAFLQNELDNLKNIRNKSQKNEKDRIKRLEDQLKERESELGVLGNGIEFLNRQLRIRDDPNHHAVQVIEYLEQFAK